MQIIDLIKHYNFVRCGECLTMCRIQYLTNLIMIGVTALGFCLQNIVFGKKVCYTEIHP
jgi:hypothetical protein